MKVLLDIKDSKAPFVMELLKYFPFVKANEIKEAVKKPKLVRTGKKKARPAKELLGKL